MLILNNNLRQRKSRLVLLRSAMSSQLLPPLSLCRIRSLSKRDRGRSPQPSHTFPPRSQGSLASQTSGSMVSENMESLISLPSIDITFKKQLI